MEKFIFMTHRMKRGIPKDLLSTISGGTTSRWGNDRKLNRAVTIKSIEP